MKKFWILNIAFFFVLIVSCKKGEPVLPFPDRFVIVDQDKNTTIELSWKVNGNPEGYRLLNCDLYLSDTARLTEDKFVDYTFYYRNDYAGSPVLFAALGENHVTEKMKYKDYYIWIHEFDPHRAYLGIAVNGLGVDGAGLSGIVDVDYTLKVNCSGYGEKVIQGSFKYNTALASETFVHYIYTVDFDLYNLYNYSYRQLDKPIDIIRAADYEYANQLDVTQGRYYCSIRTDLEWDVNGVFPGYSFVDLDLGLSDQTGGASDVFSTVNNQYEWLRANVTTPDFSWNAYYSYYGNVDVSGFPSTFPINLRCVVYNRMNPFKRCIKSKTISSPTVPPGATYYPVFNMARSGSVITFTDL